MCSTTADGHLIRLAGVDVAGARVVACIIKGAHNGSVAGLCHL